MIQGGALDGSGAEAQSIYGGYFEDEVDEGLYHFDGAVCLGNHGPNTNGNQFYIVEHSQVDKEQLYRMNLPLKVRSHYEAVGGLPELDGRYTIFGQVIDGMSVVRKIANQATDSEDAPLEPIMIRKITFKEPVRNKSDWLLLYDQNFLYLVGKLEETITLTIFLR